MRIGLFGRVALLIAVSFAAPVRADVFVSQVPSDGSPPSILVFASDAIGDAAPIRVIAGGSTGLVAPFQIAIDTVNRELYVSDFFGAAVRVYPLDADGDVAPIRTLVDGPNSLLVWPRKVAIDTVNDEILVPSFNIVYPDPVPFSSIRVYPRTADGDVAPIRSLYGDSTMLDNPIDLVVDPLHDELITNSYSAGGPGAPGILSFSRIADGDVAPLRVIDGPATTILNYTNYLAYDAANDEIYADAAYSNQDFANVGYGVFPRDAEGNVAPVRLVSGPETGIFSISSLAYDPVNERVIVANYSDNTGSPPPVLRVFRRADDGDTVPVLSIAGPHTQLVAPSGIAIDDAGGFSGVGPQVYVVEGDFYTAIGDPSQLAIEGFDEGPTAPGDIGICDEPVSSTSNDDCFSPGQLLPGFELTSTSGIGLAVDGSNFFGNTSAVIGAILTGDATIVSFDPPVTAFAVDVFDYDGDQNASTVSVGLYDAAGTPLAFANVRPNGGAAPAFLGAIAPTAPIARIELSAAGGTALIDNLRFRRGDVIFADGFDGTP